MIYKRAHYYDGLKQLEDIELRVREEVSDRDVQKGFQDTKQILQHKFF